MLALSLLSSPIPLLAVTGTASLLGRASWPEIVQDIKAANREPAVLHLLRQITGLASLRSLETLISPRTDEFTDPLRWEETTEAVDQILQTEWSDTTHYPKNTCRQALADLVAGRKAPTAADPITSEVPVGIQGELPLIGPPGGTVGRAQIAAGGAEAVSLSLLPGDGSSLYGSTSAGGRELQQDGLYFAFYRLPDGTFVKILAGADGLGGHSGGEMASSAFLQGVHAGVVAAALRTTVPLASALFVFGRGALLSQLAFHPDMPEASTTGVIAVIAGKQATLAVAGDSMATHVPEDPRLGPYVRGYSNLEVVMGFVLTKTASSAPTCYQIPSLTEGDRLVLGSDGLWGGLLGASHKDRCSEAMRLANQLPRPDQPLFANLTHLVGTVQEERVLAMTLHNAALQAMLRPGSPFGQGTHPLTLPSDADRDNILVLTYRQGAGNFPSYPFPPWNRFHFLDAVRP